MLDLKDGDELNIEVPDGKLILSKVDHTSALDNLFLNYNGKYQPTEFDWGKPQGREEW